MSEPGPSPQPQPQPQPQPDPAPAASPTPSPSPTPTPTPQPDWRNALGPELGQHPSLTPIKDEDFVQVPRGVIKRYIDQQQYIGADKIPKPQEGWSDEQWREFDKQLGWPESPDGYQLPEVKLPEGYQADEGLQQEFVQAAHAAGIPAPKLARFWEQFIQAESKRDLEELEQYRSETRQQNEALQQKFGAAFDAKKDLANRALRAAGSEEALQRWQNLAMADGTPFLQHPAVFEMLAGVGEKLHEGNLLPGSATVTYAKTPEQLRRELDEFRSKNVQGLADEAHPEHQVLTQKWKDLIQQIAQAEGRR